MGWNILNKVKSAGIKEVLESGTKLIDEVFTNKDERLAHKQAYVTSILKDTQGARNLYGNGDNLIQKIFALVFLIAYLLLTGFMIWLVYNLVKQSVDFPNWAIAFISSIWGGMSAKVQTITDFFFGSSKGSADKTDIIKMKKDD